MLITREADYALRIMRALSDGRFEKAAVLSEQELIPRQYIYKLLKKLERAKLVDIRPGIGGGCRLVADLDRVSLLEVIRAVGDTVLVNACLDSAYQCGWEARHRTRCQYHLVLAELQRKIERELKQTTLRTLFEGAQADASTATQFTY